MEATDEEGFGLVKKPTAFLCNSQHIAEELSLRCGGGHRHVQLTDGRAHKAEVYSRKQDSSASLASSEPDDSDDNHDNDDNPAGDGYDNDDDHQPSTMLEMTMMIMMMTSEGLPSLSLRLKA